MDPTKPEARLPVSSHSVEFFRLLQSLGFDPTHIVDIGANHGNWTRAARAFFQAAHYSLFEPQPRLREAMTDLLAPGSNVQLHSMGVGAQSGEMEFSLHERDDSCSFALSPQEAAQRGLRQIPVMVTTLDDFVQQNSQRPPDFLKIDAEGWDLEVLKGAEKTLETTRVVLIEAGVGNKDFINDVASVLSAMSRHGYRLLDFSDLIRTPTHKALWLLELAFVKRGDSLDVEGAAYK